MATWLDAAPGQRWCPECQQIKDESEFGGILKHGFRDVILNDAGCLECMKASLRIVPEGFNELRAAACEQNGWTLSDVMEDEVQYNYLELRLKVYGGVEAVPAFANGRYRICYLCGRSLIWVERDLKKFAEDAFSAGYRHGIIEHKLPKSRGGINTPGNLAPACVECNVEKRSFTESEIRAAWRQRAIDDRRRKARR